MIVITSKNKVCLDRQARISIITQNMMKKGLCYHASISAQEEELHKFDDVNLSALEKVLNRFP
jgi:hypothetical protein